MQLRNRTGTQVLQLAFLCVVSIGAEAAEHRYIIPVFSSRFTSGGQEYRSTIQLANPGPTDASARVDRLYGTSGEEQCSFITPVMQARETSPLAPVDESCDGKLFAIEVVADSRIFVESETSGANIQRTPVFDQWLAAGREYWIPVFKLEEFAYRSNLFVVNREEQPIELTLHLRRFYGAKIYDREQTITVGARSLAVQALADIPHPDQSGCTQSPPCSPTTMLVLRSTGRFVAGVSSIHRRGEAMFYEVRPIEP